MNILVITTYDITPEQWADFANTAVLEKRHPDAKTVIPYILVYSHSQKHHTHETERISATITTEFSPGKDFSAAAWEEIKHAHYSLYKQEPITTHPDFFCILDKQAADDRRVIIMEKGCEWVNAEGKKYQPLPGDGEPTTTIWKRHRVPFEEADETCCLLAWQGLGGYEPYLEEVTKESYYDY
ncbi:hypothetical protein BU16DRAFT_542023 [Lophium mytilinum]|uniref:Uncharacterized protein n=1 Tax=Lophium mytilinum TaxID=390894 RepID=A0A6A6QJF9_9PEZI|nr:hypothetical protein BU16DRAFT_542023 [Lophium mytilinum]